MADRHSRKFEKHVIKLKNRIIIIILLKTSNIKCPIIELHTTTLILAGNVINNLSKRINSCSHPEANRYHRYFYYYKGHIIQFEK